MVICRSSHKRVAAKNVDASNLLVHLPMHHLISYSGYLCSKIVLCPCKKNSPSEHIFSFSVHCFSNKNEVKTRQSQHAENRFKISLLTIFVISYVLTTNKCDCMYFNIRYDIMGPREESNLVVQGEEFLVVGGRVSLLCGQCLVSTL